MYCTIILYPVYIALFYSIRYAYTEIKELAGIYMSEFICHSFAEYITNTFRAVKYTLQNEMENGPNHYTGLLFIPD